MSATTIAFSSSRGASAAVARMSFAPNGNEFQRMFMYPRWAATSTSSSPSPLYLYTRYQNQQQRTIVTNHNFNTNKVVNKLEQNGFSRGASEVLMNAMKSLLRQHTHKIRKNMLTSADLGNESYLFKAALTELRTELQILRKNDAAALAIKTEVISRDIDSLHQKLREDIANVKNEIAIDVNSRRGDVREEQKQLEIRIQSMSNRYMAQLGDMRTQLEAAKWETTRKGMVSIFLAACVVLLASRFFTATKEENLGPDYMDPYISHANAGHLNGDKEGMVPDNFVVSHRDR